MSEIFVCSLDWAHDIVNRKGARRVVSLLSPDQKPPRFASIPKADHLCLAFNDVAAATPGMVAASSAQAQAFFDFVDDWDQANPMLLHCWAGISRSPAAVYAVLCRFQPDASEEAHAAALRKLSATCTPNPLFVAHADALLAREGRMVNAIAALGRGAEAFIGEPFKVTV